VTGNRQHKPKPSKSYLRFERVILRSLNLVSLHDILRERLGTADSPLDFSDLLRASVVLAVAAMDAYFTDVFAERLVPFLKKKGPTKDLAQLLGEAGLNTDVALELLSMERPFRRIRTLLESCLELHVTQRIDAINELFKAYGIPNLCEHVERKLGRTQLCRRVDLLVERRHAIAHDGDLNSHGRLMDINATWVKNKLQDVVIFVSTADEILYNQLG